MHCEDNIIGPGTMHCAMSSAFIGIQSKFPTSPNSTFSFHFFNPLSDPPPPKSSSPQELPFFSPFPPSKPTQKTLTNIKKKTHPMWHGIFTEFSTIILKGSPRMDCSVRNPSWQSLPAPETKTARWHVARGKTPERFRPPFLLQGVWLVKCRGKRSGYIYLYIIIW